MGGWQGLKGIKRLAHSRCSMNIHRNPGSLGSHQFQDHVCYRHICVPALPFLALST